MSIDSVAPTVAATAHRGLAAIRRPVWLSPVELHLVASAAQGKLDELAAQESRIRADIADTGGESYSSFRPALDNIAGMRRIYEAIVRQVEGALDVPFLTSEDARVALAEAGVAYVDRTASGAAPAAGTVR